MNIAIGNKTFGRNFRFGVGAFVTALSAALIVGVGIWLLSDSPSSQTVAEGPAAPAVRPIDTAPRSLTPVVYYLVNSQDQIDGLVQAEFEASVNNSWTQPDSITRVIDLRTPDGQALYRTLQEDLYTTATLDSGFDASLVQFHDLAAPAGVTTVQTANAIPSAGSFRADASPATVYIVGSEIERQQLLQEADVAAAVEGSDNALPTIVVIDHSDTEALQLEEAITEDKLHGGIGANVIDLR